jgi:hypothetical protein
MSDTAAGYEAIDLPRSTGGQTLGVLADVTFCEGLTQLRLAFTQRERGRLMPGRGASRVGWRRSVR